MFCFAMLADQNEDTIYSDLPGRFPVQSYAGNNCGICLQNQFNINEANEKQIRRKHGESIHRYLCLSKNKKPTTKAARSGQ
jgi:hypothetical protein